MISALLFPPVCFLIILCIFLLRFSKRPLLILDFPLPSSSLSFLLPLSFSAVDESGSVGSGQPLVNAMRTDSALIGGTELFHHVVLYLY